MKNFPTYYLWYERFLSTEALERIDHTHLGTFKGQTFQHITLKQGFTLKEKRSASWIGSDWFGVVEMIFDNPEDLLETLTADNIIETK